MEYYDTGKLESKSCYINGESVSDSIYSEKGYLENTVQYLNKDTHVHTIFHENGKVNCKGNYIKGQLHGLLKCFGENGIIESETMYEKGVEIWLKRYGKDGIEVFEGTKN
jgi:antitoxin component YwqK of YwqJK toxin-antitoxin module